jgi:hypothetical protein
MDLTNIQVRRVLSQTNSPKIFQGKPLTIELVGGLGNQLFGFFAGVYWAKLNNGNVKFIRSSQENHSSKIRSSILDFDLPSQDFMANTRVTRLMSEGRELITDFRKTLGRGHPVLSSIWAVPHYSQNSGFDSELEHLPPGTKVKGYFQTHRYWSELQSQDAIRGFSLREPSNWFLTHLQKAEEERPIMLHIRRGDYKSHSSSIGLLGEKYFMSALEIAKDIAPHSSVWLFTDEPNGFDSEFLDGQAKYCFKPHPPSGTNAAEVMLLMSKGAVNITSNSTFSWWASTLGKAQRVIAPSKWFKSGDDPADLIPSDWMRVKSYWE